MTKTIFVEKLAVKIKSISRIAVVVAEYDNDDDDDPLSNTASY